MKSGHYNIEMKLSKLCFLMYELTYSGDIKGVEIAGWWWGKCGRDGMGTGRNVWVQGGDGDLVIPCHSLAAASF